MVWNLTINGLEFDYKWSGKPGSRGISFSDFAGHHEVATNKKLNRLPFVGLLNSFDRVD